MKSQKEIKSQKWKKNNENKNFSELETFRIQSMSVSDNVSVRQSQDLVNVRVRSCHNVVYVRVR